MEGEEGGEGGEGNSVAGVWCRQADTRASVPSLPTSPATRSCLCPSASCYSQSVSPCSQGELLDDFEGHVPSPTSAGPSETADSGGAGDLLQRGVALRLSICNASLSLLSDPARDSDGRPTAKTRAVPTGTAPESVPEEPLAASPAASDGSLAADASASDAAERISEAAAPHNLAAWSRATSQPPVAVEEIARLTLRGLTVACSAHAARADEVGSPGESSATNGAAGKPTPLRFAVGAELKGIALFNCVPVRGPQRCKRAPVALVTGGWAASTVTAPHPFALLPAPHRVHLDSLRVGPHRPHTLWHL